MSLYVGYFAQGFGLDSSGLEKCNCLGIYIIFEYNPDTGLNNEGIASNADILKHGKMWKDNGPEKIKLAIKMTGVGQSFKKIEDKIKQLIKHGGKENACCKKEKYNLYLFGHGSKKKGFLFPVKLKLFDPLEGDVENAKHNKPFVGNLRFKVTEKNQYQRYSIDNGGLGVESFKKATSGSCFTTLVACWSNKTKRWKGFKGQAYKEKYNYALNKRTSNDNHVEVYPKKK